MFSSFLMFFGFLLSDRRKNLLHIKFCQGRRIISAFEEVFNDSFDGDVEKIRENNEKAA